MMAGDGQRSEKDEKIFRKKLRKNLHNSKIIRNICNVLENTLRVWAAAQQRPSKLASAFTLHHTCRALGKRKSARSDP